MSKPSLIVLSIVVLLIALAIGGGAGIFYQMQKDAPQLAKSDAIKVLSSRVIPSIIAYGQLTDINGRNISLTFNGDNLTVKIKDDALIYSLVTDAEGQSNQQKVDFNQIKKGDNININIKVLPDGQLEGQTVFILPIPAIAPVQ